MEEGVGYEHASEEDRFGRNISNLGLIGCRVIDVFILVGPLDFSNIFGGMYKYTLG